MKRLILRMLPFFVLIIIISAVWLTSAHKYISLETIKEQEKLIRAYISAHPFLAPLIYCSIYIVSVILIIPDSTILTLLAGFVFPRPLALLLSVASETIGAVAFFWIVHGFLGSIIIAKKETQIEKLQKGFRENALSYLLFLRISHIIPFWLTNVSAVYFRVRFRIFFWATFLGVIPLSYILVQVGHVLAQYLESGEKFSLWRAMGWQTKIAFVFLALLALSPVLYKKLTRKK